MSSINQFRQLEDDTKEINQYYYKKLLSFAIFCRMSFMEYDLGKRLPKSRL